MTDLSKRTSAALTPLQIAGNQDERYDSGMSTLAEIELAARRLSPVERQQLLIAVAQSLRQENAPLPDPRLFSSAEMEAWMDDDERDPHEFRGTD